MEETQEKLLRHERVKIDLSKARTPFTELDEEVQLAIRCALDKKAEDLTVLDIRDIASFAEFFVIATGNNPRQVLAIADEIGEQLKKQTGARVIRKEGYSTAEWVLLDYGDFIVHIFDKAAREFYDLERLWLDANRVELPKEEAGV